MRTLTMEEKIQKIRDLIYDARMALCWPVNEDTMITSSMVSEFMETNILSIDKKTERLKKAWEATGEILDIMNGKYEGLAPPEIHWPKQCKSRI